MVLIYSDNEIPSLVGAYIAPIYFVGVEKGVSKVYTDNKAIVEAYKAVDVEVLPLTVKATKKA